MLLVSKVLIMKHQIQLLKWLKLELILLLRMVKIKNVKIDIGQPFIILAHFKMELLFQIHARKIVVNQKLLDWVMIKYLNVGILLCLNSIQETRQLFTVLVIKFMEPKFKNLLWEKLYQLTLQLIFKLKF